MLVRKEKERKFATAYKNLSMVIPPSNILIVYSLASGGASIAALFLARDDFRHIFNESYL